jgi:hypothetical protein
VYRRGRALVDVDALETARVAQDNRQRESNQKLSGNKVDYTIFLILLAKNMLCSKLPVQKVFDLVLFSYKYRRDRALIDIDALETARVAQDESRRRALARVITPWEVFGCKGLGKHLVVQARNPQPTFGVGGLGIGVWGLGFRDLGFGAGGLGFGVWGLGFEVWGLGFGVWGLGCRLWC